KQAHRSCEYSRPERGSCLTVSRSMTSKRLATGLFLIGALIAGILVAVDSGDGVTGVSTASTTARAQSANDQTPVVMIIFDELPTATLMNRAGTAIDAKRFPAFANLAHHSTW